MGWAYGLGGEGGEAGEEDDANRAPVRWGEVRVGAGPPGNRVGRQGSVAPSGRRERLGGLTGIPGYRATGLLGVVVGKGGHLNPVI